VVARGSDLVGLLTYMIDGSECEILTLHVDERAQGEAHRSVFGDGDPDVLPRRCAHGFDAGCLSRAPVRDGGSEDL